MNLNLLQHMSASGREGLQIDIQMARLDPQTGEYVARCLRRLVNVDRVLTSVKGEAEHGAGRGVCC